MTSTDEVKQQVNVRVPEEVLAVLRGRTGQFAPRTIAGPAPPFDLMENCAFKSVLSFGAGGAMGLFFGVFLGTTSSMDVDVNAPTKQQVIQQYKSAWRQGVSMSKSFAVVGLLFSGSECLIEKARGKSDKLNSLAAGCTSGALLTARAGPQAMAVGCAGFMAFSAVIDLFMHPKDVRESYSTPTAYKKLPRTMDDVDWPWYSRMFS